MIDQFLSILGEIKALFQMIGEDGYLHLVMEPLFTYGIGFGLLLFIVALVARERMSRTFALLILMVSSVFIYPYQHKREESAPRTGYRENWTTESQELWDQQTARRQQFQYLYYLLALAALLNIVISPESLLGKGLAGMVLLGGTVVLICGLWLNLQEKRIFFPDLRYDPGGRPPPVSQAADGAGSRSQAWLGESNDVRVSLAQRTT